VGMLYASAPPCTFAMDRDVNRFARPSLSLTFSFLGLSRVACRADATQHYQQSSRLGEINDDIASREHVSMAVTTKKQQPFNKQISHEERSDGKCSARDGVHHRRVRGQLGLVR